MVTVELNRGRVTVYEPVRVTVPGYRQVSMSFLSQPGMRYGGRRTAVTDTVELPATKVVASGQYVS